MAGDEVWIRRAAHSLARSWELMVESAGGRTTTLPEAFLADGASANPFMNAVTLRRPLTDAESAEFTGRLERYFGERPAGGPWLLWSFWPTPDLASQGYALWGHPPVMIREPGGVAPPPPPELRIVEATTEAELAVFERTFVEGYPALGLDPAVPGQVFGPSLLGGPFRFWIGYVGDEPVAVAGAVIEDDLIDVTFVATQPHARRRGYGAALTWTATVAEPSLPAVLEASDDGRPVYERMGYREVGRMSLWERPRDPANPVYSPYCPPRP